MYIYIYIYNPILHCDGVEAACAQTSQKLQAKPLRLQSPQPQLNPFVDLRTLKGSPKRMPP